MEEVLVLGDDERRGVVLVAVATTDEVAADSAQLDAGALDQEGDRDLALDSVDQVVGDSGHRRPRFPAPPVKRALHAAPALRMH